MFDLELRSFIFSIPCFSRNFNLENLLSHLKQLRKIPFPTLRAFISGLGKLKLGILFSHATSNDYFYVLFIYINNMFAYLAFATFIRRAKIWKEFVSKYLRPTFLFIFNGAHLSLFLFVVFLELCRFSLFLPLNRQF